MAGRSDTYANSYSNPNSYGDTNAYANTDAYAGTYGNRQRYDHQRHERQGRWRDHRHFAGTIRKPDDDYERQRKLLVLRCRDGLHVYDHTIE